jgi:uncharacterized membrane protein
LGPHGLSRAPLRKTIALVTRVVRDTPSGREMAIVYVPTSPNPTSASMKIVPADQLTSLDWSLDEAMRFVITGGTNAQSQMDFRPIRQADTATPSSGEEQHRCRSLVDLSAPSYRIPAHRRVPLFRRAPLL